MTQSIYVLGGAAVGKSTFMQDVLSQLEAEYLLRLAPQEDLQMSHNSRGSRITLRGHPITRAADDFTGMYLGKMRDHFPGTDGLDRVSGFVGVEWLQCLPLPDFIVAEGATLATDNFLKALSERTNLLVLHLVCDPVVQDLRALSRGHELSPNFVQGTTSRSLNRVARLHGGRVVEVDTTSGSRVEGPWPRAVETAVSHLTL